MSAKSKIDTPQKMNGKGSTIIKSDLMALTKIEFDTLHYSAHFEYLYTQIRRTDESIEDLLAKENNISSTIDDLSELLHVEFPKEIKELNSLRNKMWASAKKMTKSNIVIDDNSFYYLINTMLGEIIRIKIKEYGLYKNEAEMLNKILTTYTDSPGYSTRKQGQDIPEVIIELADQVKGSELNDQEPLATALKFLSKKFEADKKASRIFLGKNGKPKVKLEADYRRAIKVIGGFKKKVEEMWDDISTIYENLESLTEDPDKVKEKKTIALIKKYKDRLVMPVLDKNNSFIGGIEDAKSNFHSMHLHYIDDEVLAGGSILSKAMDKIVAVKG